MAPHPAGRDGPSVSDIFADLPHRLTETATIEDLIAALGGRAHGLTVAAVSIPAIVPTPGIPAGLVFGTILAVFAAQITTGASSVILPRWLAYRPVSPRVLDALAGRGSSLVWRVERFTRSRLTHVASPASMRWLGPFLFLLGLLIALPIPFGNTLPGLGALLIGVGIASRDGLVVLYGLAVGVAGLIVSLGLIYGGWRVASSFLGGA
ncbi:MAG: exopolysaccharide biosynthesis protein [Gammaproteobacteria bacterium]|nr:exopolysaccharide biosynthesis protein [Gammaproteobacteria bacterium]